MDHILYREIQKPLHLIWHLAIRNHFIFYSQVWVGSESNYKYKWTTVNRHVLPKESMYHFQIWNILIKERKNHLNWRKWLLNFKIYGSCLSVKKKEVSYPNNLMTWWKKLLSILWFSKYSHIKCIKHNGAWRYINIKA